MKQVEDFIASDLLQRIEEIIESAKGELIAVTLLSSLAILIIVGAGYLSVREG